MFPISKVFMGSTNKPVYIFLIIFLFKRAQEFTFFTSDARVSFGFCSPVQRTDMTASVSLKMVLIKALITIPGMFFLLTTKSPCFIVLSELFIYFILLHFCGKVKRYYLLFQTYHILILSWDTSPWGRWA